MKSTICYIIFLLVSFSDAQPQQCNVCVGDGAIDPNANFGPIPCGDWLAGASDTPDGIEACTLHRSAGAQFCGCGQREEYETCYLCGDAASNAFADATRYIPDSPGGSLTCADLMEMPIVDAGATCPLFKEKYQRWCGCPNSPPTAPCAFCEGGGNPNMELDYPFTDGSGRGCSQLHDWYQVQTSSSCAAARQADSQFYFIDMPAYCECPGREPPKVCQGSYCPSGEGIQTDQLSTLIDENTGITCGDNSFLLKMITKQEDCELLYSTSSMCCSPPPSGIVFEAAAGTLSSSASIPRMKTAAALASFFLLMTRW